MPRGIAQGEGQSDPSRSQRDVPAQDLRKSHQASAEMARICLCCLLEPVKSFLLEITNPGAFTAPLLKSTFHSSVSSCLPSARDCNRYYRKCSPRELTLDSLKTQTPSPLLPRDAGECCALLSLHPLNLSEIKNKHFHHT